MAIDPAATEPGSDERRALVGQFRGSWRADGEPGGGRVVDDFLAERHLQADISVLYDRLAAADGLAQWVPRLLEALDPIHPNPLPAGSYLLIAAAQHRWEIRRETP